MTRLPYALGHVDAKDCAVFIGEQPVAKLVHLPDADRECDRLLVLTAAGTVFLRSIDGCRGPRLETRDLFYDPSHRGAPVVVTV